METENLASQVTENTPKIGFLFTPKTKLLIGILLIIILTLGGYLLLPRIAHFIPFLKTAGVKSKVDPRLIKQTSLSKLPLESHPSLYTINLDYNKKTSTTKEVGTNRTNGDTPAYTDKQPKSLSGDFVYKIEILDDKDNITQTGWQLIPSELLDNNKDDIVFQVTTSYKKGYSVKVSSINNNLLWTGKIQ